MSVLNPSREPVDHEPAVDAPGDAEQFRSILYLNAASDAGPDLQQPDCFGDLNLDQVCAAIFAGREDYELTPLFYAPLHDQPEVGYRQAVCRDLQREQIAAVIRASAERMSTVRKRADFAHRLPNRFQKQHWLLAALEAYCEAVTRLDAELAVCELRSTGLQGLRAYLSRYSRSSAFKRLIEETTATIAELAAVQYTVQIQDLKVTVDLPDDEPDLTTQVERTFAKFRQGDVKDYRVKFASYLGLGHVEEQVLERVVWLFPEPFQHLHEYCKRNHAAFDQTLLRFDREVQFFLAYLEYIAPLQATGLSFCHPRVSTGSKQARASSAFDLALAAKLVRVGRAVVTNDVVLGGAERVLVITGPNQGGKTTFARMFGQLHHLAALGLPVPGTAAELFLPDRIFTHFEREEDLSTLHSKFEDDLYRVHAILEAATADSVLVMNESLTSTTLQDAITVGTHVLSEIIDRELLCLFVTFVDELGSLGAEVVSMMSTVDPEDPATRTFKVIRKPPDGRAYALALAEKYGLGYAQLARRVRS